MEKLSLEKFNKFELSKNSAFKVKGGDVPTGEGSIYQHTIGTTAVGVTYSSDTNHTNGAFSCNQTDVDLYENE
jgi:hypothetical protein